MPWGLKRYYGTAALHFITWSCYRRSPLLDTDQSRDLLLTVLERMRERYRFGVVGYVVMPEHVHLLISEPQIGNPSTVVQAVKLGFNQRWRAIRGVSGQFWQRRFYDFNVWSQRKEVEKLKYMHRNPVVRGLVEKPDDWRWSSYRSFTHGEEGLVRLNDCRWWEKKIRDKRVDGVIEDIESPTSRAKSAREMGHPSVCPNLSLRGIFAKSSASEFAGIQL